MTTKKKFKDFESALARLEELTDLLEAGDNSLEHSIKFYTEGLEIAKFCNEKLTEAEKKIKIITNSHGSQVEKDFEPEQEESNDG